MSVPHSKMNIIEKFVIGAFTPPPDLKPLQFHEVSRVLQTRLQESNKNINIVKIIQGANKSPRLQIQVEKTSKKQTEYKEKQTEEKVSKNENEKNKFSQNKVLKTSNNDNETTVSKITKKKVQTNSSPKNILQKNVSPRDEKNKRQVSRKSIENGIDKNISKPMKKGSKNDKKETEKIKMTENNQHKNKKKNTRTNKTDKECVHSQTSVDKKGKENEFSNPDKNVKRRDKQNIIKPGNHVNEGNKIEKDKIIKSTTKENEKNEENIKRSLRVRTKTNEKIETNVNCKKSEIVEDNSSKLQTDTARRSKGEGNHLCDNIMNLDKVEGNSLNKKPQYRKNESMQTIKDVDLSSEVSSIDQTFHEYDESFSLGNKVKQKPKNAPRISLNPLMKKIKERRQSKITTFMAAEKSRDNKVVKNISNEDKSLVDTHLPNMEACTPENVLEESKQNKQHLHDDDEKNSREKESKRKSVSEEYINMKKIQNFKKVRRSIVNELNESAISDLDTDVVGEGDKENMVSDKKRKSSKANPKSNNEDISEEPSNKKRKTETEAKTLQSGNKKTKVTKTKTVAKTKELHSKKKSENEETNKHTEKKKSASEKELPKSKQNENYFINDMVETNGIEMEPKRLSLREKDIDKEKPKNMKVRRSIVNELNESAISDLDTDVGEGDKENMVSDKKRKSSKANPKSNKEDISKEPIKKRKTEAKTLHSDNKKGKTAKTKTVVKTKESNSKKNLNKETTKPSQINGSSAEKVLAKSKQNGKSLLDVIEKSKKQTKTKKVSVSEKDIDMDTVKKNKKVRRSIVTELNESALSDMETDVVEEGDKENMISDKKIKSSKAKSKSKNDISEESRNKKKVETKTLQSVNKKTKQPKTKPLAKTKQSNSKKESDSKETTKPPENNRAAAEAKARELLMPEDCPITAKRGTMKYLEQRTTLLKAIDDQRESEGDIFSSNIFKKKSGLANLLVSDNVDDTLAIRTPSSKGTKNDDGGVSPFTPRTGMFADWASLGNTSTSKTPTVNTLPTPKVDTEHKKVVMQVTYHMQKNKRRGIRKLQTNDEDEEKIVKQPSKLRKKNKSLIDLPNMPEEDGDLDDLGDDYFF